MLAWLRYLATHTEVCPVLSIQTVRTTVGLYEADWIDGMLQTMGQTSTVAMMRLCCMGIYPNRYPDTHGRSIPDTSFDHTTRERVHIPATYAPLDGCATPAIARSGCDKSEVLPLVVSLTDDNREL